MPSRNLNEGLSEKFLRLSKQGNMLMDELPTLPGQLKKRIGNGSNIAETQL